MTHLALVKCDSLFFSVLNMGILHLTSIKQKLERRQVEKMYLPEKTQGPIRVLIVDDHQILREGLGIILSREDGFEVVGEAGTAEEAMVLATQYRPDILLLDVSLGKAIGLDTAKCLQTICPTARIVILAGFDDEDLLLAAMQMGVDGFLQKATSVEDLLSTLRTTHQGERAIGKPYAI